MQGNVLSNVIGAPFNQYVIDQLNVRSANGSTQNRSSEQILYLANKMSWTRLTSSIKIKPKGVLGLPTPLSKFYANLFNGEIPPGDYSTPESLAKNWILQAGTSEYDNGTYNLRFGLGPNSAYGLGGINQQGYRPMPGLTSVTIDTKGTLGSLREATINFSVWNMTQLNVIEALYFRLGYTMLLEWGNINYFTNPTVANPSGEFVTSPYGIDFFSYNSKESIFQAITERNQRTNGNYEAMLGTVTNFFFSFNSQGGYDCSIKLIGLGSIIDTIKVNQTFIMPESLAIQIQQANEVVQANAAEQLRKKDEESRKTLGLPQTLVGEATSVEGISAIYQADKGEPLSDVLSLAYPRVDILARGATNTSVDYFYRADAKITASGSAELNEKRTGLFLDNNSEDKRSTFNYITYTKPQSVSLFTNSIGFFAGVDRKGFLNNESDYRAQTRLLETLTTAAGFDFDKIFATNTGEILTDTSQQSPTFNSAVQIFDSAIVNVGNEGDRLTDPITKKVIATIPYTANVTLPGTTTVKEQQYFIRFIFNPTGQPKFTRQELINALDQWFLYNKTIQIDKIGTFPALGSNYIGVSGTLLGLAASNGQSPKITIQFNDTGIIDKKLATPPPTGEPTPQQGSTIDSQGTTEGGENGTTAAQDEQKEKFASSLHTMLTAVGAIGRSKAVGNTNAVIPIDLTETTRIFYNSGILQNVLNTPSLLALNNQIANNLDIFGVRQRNLNQYDSNLISNDFNLTTYAIKGFNSNLMADKTNFSKINDVNWTDLCTAYYVAYEFVDNETMTSSTAEKPVYIKLGYLLAFLNNMCLLYESTSKDNSSKGNSSNTVKPYIYIDFHPEYNLCLTSPLHMTIDPYKCLIPLTASDDDYVSLFKDVKAKEVIPDIFKPTKENTLSNGLKGFKTDNAYRGRTMEILLNTQFLLDLANRYITSDQFSTLNLKPFLDALMGDINKSTGNFNMFRVAYRDDSNTIIIKDDQWTPNLPGETSVLLKEDYLANRKYMELQVFGSGSLVRDMEFRTNMNTKMSSMVAISAQSGRPVANGTNASPIGTYNINYEDSIMAIKQDASSGSLGKNDKKKLTKEQQDEEAKKQQEILNTNNDAAIKFDSYVRAVYFGGRIPTSQTNSVTKYYQDRLTIQKGTDLATEASEFIPANLSITLDGISGIVMGNAFTIPENRLPASLRGDDGFTKVGFVVVGLTHTLENNQWLTKIRGQMIKLRQRVNTATRTISSNTNEFKYPPSTGPLTFTGDAFENAVNFVKQQENLASTQKSDTSKKNSRPPSYAPKNPSPSLILYPYNLEGNLNDDGTPRLTIGWGTNGTFRAGPKAGKNITSSDTITAQQADENLRVVLASLYKEVLSAARKYNITPTTGQVVGLLSLGYNAGLGGLKKSPLWNAFISKRIPNRGDSVKYEVGSDFAGSLGRRRTLEYNAFIS